MTNLELRGGSGGGHGRIKLDAGLGDSRRLGRDFSGIVNLWRDLASMDAKPTPAPLSLQTSLFGGCSHRVGPGGQGLTGTSGKSVILSQNSFFILIFF